MIDSLSIWIKENNLSVIKISDHLYKIKNGGVFYLMESKEGKIFDSDLHLCLYQEDIEAIQESEEEVNNILFLFGGRYYYTPFSEEKYFDNEHIKIDFLDFKFIGKRKSDLKEPFIHLGVHSEYELMNGSRVAKDWVAKCKFLGYKSLGMIDKNSIAGTLSFQLACDKAEIKPVFGETIDVAYSISSEGQAETNELVVYVKNKEGWNNLLRINEKINVENGGYITEEQLLALSSGLILVFSKESIINKISDLRRILKYIKTYSEHFEDVYYQLDSVDYFDEYKYEEYALCLTRYFNSLSEVLKPILIGDSYYLDTEEAISRIYLNETKKVRSPLSSRQHFKSLKEHVEDFHNVYNVSDEPKYSGKTFFDLLTDGIENTVKVADECNFKIPTSDRNIPEFEYDGDREDLFFKELNKGFREKIIKEGLDKKIYLERLEEEADLIVKAGLVDYFLILWDLIAWCRDEDIYVGSGRGSVVGSLVAYLLGITDVNPVPYDLLFERFLNKTRSLPVNHYIFELENGDILKFKEGDKIRLISGEFVNVEDISKKSDIDLDFSEK